MPLYNHQCEPCGETHFGYFPLTTSPPPSCPKCGLIMEKMWTSHGNRPATGYPYVTCNIDPSGKPIEVLSPLHESWLCKEYGVVKRDDAAWLEKQYEGYNVKGKKQSYREGRGVGMPGCWV